MDALGFNLVGYGCTTCIGNSGPLPEHIHNAIEEKDLVVTSVLSGNRNFEGRVHPLTKANYLMSPPLVVAYAIAGSLRIDLVNDPIGKDSDGNDVFLKDIWPTAKEIAEVVGRCVTREMFASKYADVFTGDEHWRKIQVPSSMTYEWKADSTYIKNPPYFEGMQPEVDAHGEDVKEARVLALLRDSITTDHISPAGSIAKGTPAEKYLLENGVSPENFNSYGSRRGNHEVMMRGTFANVRIKNELVPGTEGGVTKYIPDNEKMSIYDAAMKYKADNTPLVVVAGKEYGTGSSRDWAAKGTNLLGIKAVIAESFERIHRSNLVGMGVLPLLFKDGESWESLGMDGSEIISLTGLEKITPHMDVKMTITFADGATKETTLLCRIDTEDEVDYFYNGGILQKVIRDLTAA